MFILVEYAYPSSKTAARYGFSATGCYTVVLCPDSGFDNWRNVSAHSTRAEALQYAETLDLPTHPAQGQ